MTSLRLGRVPYAGILAGLFMGNVLIMGFLAAAALFADDRSALVLRPVLWLGFVGLAGFATALRIRDIGWPLVVGLLAIAAVNLGWSVLINGTAEIFSHHPNAGHSVHPGNPFAIRSLIFGPATLALLFWPGRKTQALDSSAWEPPPAFGRRVSRDL